MYRIGLDLGSSYTKGVLVDKAGKVVDRVAIRTGYDFSAASKKTIDRLSKGKKIEYPVYSCGYGREQLKEQFIPNSEIIALTKAVFERYGRGGVILDIGGQDTKYIKMTEKGIVDRFKLNRKCAAGTGSFLEEIAFRLDVSIEDFNELAEKATEEIKLGSFCTVFAISEIIGMIKKGVLLPNIVMGIYNSVIDRAMELSPVGESLILTGGVPAAHPMIVKLFKNIHPDTICPEHAQFMAAYGAVLLNIAT